MKRSVAALVVTTSLVFVGAAFAQGKPDKVVKVGSLGDQSGLYADIGGPGSSVAAQMAIEDSPLPLFGPCNISKTMQVLLVSSCSKAMSRYWKCGLRELYRGLK